MLNKPNISQSKKKIIVYIALVAVTLGVFWQVNQFEFVNFDDHAYVTGNSHVQTRIKLDGLRWAFGTKYYHLWHPLVWLSFMLDYQIYGLNAGGYHLTNLILHILSTLLLFWLFNHMTKAIWKSAFVAALFAFHPLHVESVAWISERKDVLSAFFWMLTLCLYVYYTEKPAVKRYLLVLFSFVLALLSKPMAITLPAMMILLDYWPLSRFRIGIESQKRNLFLWQMKEKLPFIILSLVLVIITFYNPGKIDAKYLPFSFRLANVPVSCVTYIGKTFWPHDMAVFYPFFTQIPVWQVMGATFLIIVISAIVILMARRLPYLFIGWLWFTITLLPVVKIIPVGNDAMADRYHYLPSIGIAIMLAWGVPLLFKRDNFKKKILFSGVIFFLTIMAFLSWNQCGYWKNSIDLANHALQVTKNNFMANNNLASALVDKGKFEEAIFHYDEAIRLEPGYADAYYNRGIVYGNLGNYRQAFKDYNQAIKITPDNSSYYNNRGFICIKLGLYQQAIDDYNKAISLKPDYADAYNNRAFVYLITGDIESGCKNAKKACELGTCSTLQWAAGKGLCR